MAVRTCPFCRPFTNRPCQVIRTKAALRSFRKLPRGRLSRRTAIRRRGEGPQRGTPAIRRPMRRRGKYPSPWFHSSQVQHDPARRSRAIDNSMVLIFLPSTISPPPTWKLLFAVREVRTDHGLSTIQNAAQHENRHVQQFFASVFQNEWINPLFCATYAISRGLKARQSGEVVWMTPFRPGPFGDFFSQSLYRLSFGPLPFPRSVACWVESSRLRV